MNLSIIPIIGFGCTILGSILLFSNDIASKEQSGIFSRKRIKIIGFIITTLGSIILYYSNDIASKEQSDMILDTNQDTKALLKSKEKPNALVKRLAEIIDNEYKIAEKKLQSESQKESIGQMIQKVKEVKRISSIQQNEYAKSMIQERQKKANNFSIFAKPLIELLNREIGSLLKQLLREGYFIKVTSADGTSIDYDSLFKFSNISVKQKHINQTILAHTKKNEKIIIAYIDIYEHEITIVFSPKINRMKVVIRENLIKVDWLVGTEENLTRAGGGMYQHTELEDRAKKEELIKTLRESFLWSLSGLIE